MTYHGGHVGWMEQQYGLHARSGYLRLLAIRGQSTATWTSLGTRTFKKNMVRTHKMLPRTPRDTTYISLRYLSLLTIRGQSTATCTNVGTSTFKKSMVRTHKTYPRTHRDTAYRVDLPNQRFSVHAGP